MDSCIVLVTIWNANILSSQIFYEVDSIIIPILLLKETNLSKVT